jgi:hypothetical protein
MPMNNDTSSLDNLRDIVVPSAVPWWPPAPGWWIVSAVLLVMLIVAGYRAWRVWCDNAYRRAAKRELRQAVGVAKIAEILKRTALCAYPRTDVAALSGSAWCQWLAETGGRKVPDDVAEALSRGVFSGQQSLNILDVSRFAEAWINRHERRIEVVEGSKHDG